MVPLIVAQGRERILLRCRSPNVRHLRVRFVKDQRGAAAIEYGLVVTLIFLAVVAGMIASGASLGDLYRGVLQRISDAIS